MAVGDTNAYFESSYPFDDDDVDGIEVANALRRNDRPGDWLDLGSGPMTAVWAAFVRSVHSIVSMDFLDENVFFLRAQVRARVVAKPYQRALRLATRRFGLPIPADGGAALLFDRIREVRLADVSVRQEDLSNKFSLVTQVGCFGCFDTKEEIENVAGLAFDYLHADGRFVSVTWLQRVYDGCRNWNGPVSSVISPGEIAAIYQSSGMTVLSEGVFPSRDRSFDRMVIVECHRPGNGRVEDNERSTPEARNG